MTLQTKLASRAANLSRKIYASLPFEFRVARLLIKLGLSDEIYGRMFYAEFIKAGVQDMPPVGKIPAEEMRDVLLAAGPRAAARLPMNYGREFGSKLWTLAHKYLKSYGDEENIREVLQESIAYLLGSSKRALKALPREQAESYIKRIVIGRAVDKVRAERRGGPHVRNDELLTRLTDPNALRQYTQMLGPTGRKLFQQKLQRVDPKHPDWPWEWLMSEVEGRTQRELAEEWGVVPATVNQWLKRNEGKIRKVFQDMTEESN